MLPLLRSEPTKKKKRKSSSADPSAMWPDADSSRASAASGNATSSVRGALTRHRAFLALLMLTVFMFFSVSSTSLLQSASVTAPAHSHIRSASSLTTSSPQEVLTFPDAAVVRDPSAPQQSQPQPQRVRRETPTPAPVAPRPDSFGIVVVTDLDKNSKVETSKKPLYVSYLQHGTLSIAPTDGGEERFSVTWGESQKFTTTMNEAGRGFELSELAWFDGKLLSFDDRTGIVYRLKNFEGAKPLVAIPEHIIMEGDGVTGKGQKHEWATVKDGELYMGSVGKEFTDNDGNMISDANLWVAVLDTHGEVRHEDWTAPFARIRQVLGCDYPGYVVHEAIEWSAVHRQWFVLPRRVSHEAYNDMLDETKGSNKMVIASEDFSSFKVIEVGTVTPLRGFSSFKFVPRTDDSVIVAIKSVEVEVEQSQTSFAMVFDIEGNMLMEETELPGGFKYEGIAFTHNWT